MDAERNSLEKTLQSIDLPRHVVSPGHETTLVSLMHQIILPYNGMVGVERVVLLDGFSPTKVLRYPSVAASCYLPLQMLDRRVDQFEQCRASQRPAWYLRSFLYRAITH
jgi:hypothetical protein